MKKLQRKQTQLSARGMYCVNLGKHSQMSPSSASASIEPCGNPEIDKLQDLQASFELHLQAATRAVQLAGKEQRRPLGVAGDRPLYAHVGSLNSAAVSQKIAFRFFFNLSVLEIARKVPSTRVINMRERSWVPGHLRIERFTRLGISSLHHQSCFGRLSLDLHSV